MSGGVTKSNKLSKRIANTLMDRSDGGDWHVVEQSSLETFHHTITTSSKRPKSITISGSNWNDLDLLEFLTRLSFIHCNVHLRLTDALEKSPETTSNWITILTKHAK